MIQYPYNLVDMGGIDLVTSNGRTVPGLYNKIMQAKDACGSLALYNWKIADIEIPPQYVAIFPMGEYLLINGAIQVTVFDVINVLISALTTQLEVHENGIYLPPAPYAGFDSVAVDVRNPVIQEWDFSQGVYHSTTYLYPSRYSGSLEDDLFIVNPTGFIKMPYAGYPYSFEITIGDYTAYSGGHSHMFGGCPSGTSVTPSNSVIWARSERWAFLTTGSGGAAEYFEGDFDLFKNSVVTFSLSDSGTLEIKKDGSAVATTSGGFFSSLLSNMVLIGSYTGSLQMEISRIRILDNSVH